MNREIKFRAWDGEKMIYPNNEQSSSAKILLHYTNIMQYIGLSDKNSKEIYECDIIRFSYTVDGNRYEVEEKILFGIVEYSEGEWVIAALDEKEHWIFDLIPIYHKDKNVRVIGNKYKHFESTKNEIEHISSGQTDKT